MDEAITGTPQEGATCYTVLSHLDRGSCAVRITFLDFFFFQCLQHHATTAPHGRTDRDGSRSTPGGPRPTGRPRYIRLGDYRSNTVVCSTGSTQDLSIFIVTVQGTAKLFFRALSPVLFTLYTLDFQYNSELCHVQKFSHCATHCGLHQKWTGGLKKTTQLA